MRFVSVPHLEGNPSILSLLSSWFCQTRSLLGMPPLMCLIPCSNDLWGKPQEPQYPRYKQSQRGRHHCTTDPFDSVTQMNCRKHRLDRETDNPRRYWYLHGWQM